MNLEFTTGIATLERVLDPTGIKLSSVQNVMLSKYDDEGNPIEMVITCVLVVPYPDRNN